MKKNGIPLYLIKIFAGWFCKLRGRIKWRNGYCSDFYIRSGVPQESLLGGKQFNLFMDEIFEAFEKGNIGYKIDGIFAGALAYAMAYNFALSIITRHSNYA